MRPKSGKWTEVDNERIGDFVKKGVPILRAAAALNRTTTSVRNQARKIGYPFPSIREVRKKFAGDPASSWRQY
jgi:hypothetical protein